MAAHLPSLGIIIICSASSNTYSWLGQRQTSSIMRPPAWTPDDSRKCWAETKANQSVSASTWAARRCNRRHTIGNDAAVAVVLWSVLVWLTATQATYKVHQFPIYLSFSGNLKHRFGCCRELHWSAMARQPCDVEWWWTDTDEKEEEEDEQGKAALWEIVSEFSLNIPWTK